MVRVGVADDHLLMREALSRLLEHAPGIDLLAVTEDGTALRAAVDEHDLEVVVADIRMPPRGDDEGVRLAEELRAERPSVAVVVLSGYCEAEYALRLLESGSDGRAYLLKDRLSDGVQLTATIMEVASGGSVIDPKVVEMLVQADHETGRAALSALTPREREILAEMARGASNQGIAATLGLTKRAVEKHINAIFAKLELPPAPDVSRRVRAVLLFLLEGSREGDTANPREMAT
jgi:DNA-binding NarL/FixJ family response regulator